MKFSYFQGRYAGNAIGFKISSLLKLMETRANKPRMTLLHYLVEEAEKEDKHVLEFADELQQPLTAANRLVLTIIKFNKEQKKRRVYSLKKSLAHKVTSSATEHNFEFEKFTAWGSTENRKTLASYYICDVCHAGG